MPHSGKNKSRQGSPGSIWGRLAAIPAKTGENVEGVSVTDDKSNPASAGSARIAPLKSSVECTSPSNGESDTS